MGARRWMPPILFRLVVALVLSAEILAAMPVEASPTSARPTPTVAPTRVRSAAPGTPASAPSRLAPTPTRTPTRVTVGRIARVGHLGALFSAPGSPTTGVAWVWGMNQRGELGMPTGTGGASCADEACRLVPLLNQAHAGLTRVSGGFLFSLALTAAGQVWAWGAGGMGQLGSNAAGDSQTRV